MNNLYLIVILIISIFLFRWIYLFIQPQDIEKFNNDFEILPECRGITPKKLLAMFENDSEKLGNIFAQNNIPTDLITNKDSYPVIASFLVSKGIIKC